MVISIASPVVFYINTIQAPAVSSAGGGAVASVSLFVATECGDGLCELDELCSSCPDDCGECIFECGNGICDTNETCATCSEDCGTCSDPSSGGSSGGGSGSSGFTPDLRINFEFSPEIIQEQMFQGGTLIQKVNVTNIGIEAIEVDLSVINLENLIFLNEDTLYLKYGETEEFDALISIPDDTEPIVFLGDIMGEAGGVEKSLPIVLRIIEENASFKLQVNISEETKVIRPGEIVKADINILNHLENLKADFASSIRDRQEGILIEGSGKVDLDYGPNIVPQEFRVPIDTAPDYYMFFVNLSYGGKNYIDAATFRVESSEEVAGFFAGNFLKYFSIIGSIIIILILFYIIKKYLLKKGFRLANKNKKEKIVPQVSVVKTIDKLNNLKKRANKKYEYSLVEELFKIMKFFFAKYYSFNHNLTFEEMKNKLNQREIKQKQKTIRFIDKIAHLPYTYSLVPKVKFISIIDESISLLNSYKVKSKSLKVKKNLKGKR